MIRVLVAADSPLERTGLEALLASSPALVVAGHSRAGGDLARAIHELRPDVILLSVEPEEEPALELTGVESDAVVFLADDLRSAWVADVLRVGARAVLPRSSSAGEIAAAIEAVAAGLVVLHPRALDTVLPPARGNAAMSSQALTPREIEVLRRLADGFGNKELGERLGISEHTVKFHVGSILAKLGASTRTEAVTIGVRRGLIVI